MSATRARFNRERGWKQASQPSTRPLCAFRPNRATTVIESQFRFRLRRLHLVPARHDRTGPALHRPGLTRTPPPIPATQPPLTAAYTGRDAHPDPHTRSAGHVQTPGPGRRPWQRTAGDLAPRQPTHQNQPERGDALALPTPADPPRQPRHHPQQRRRPARMLLIAEWPPGADEPCKRPWTPNDMPRPNEALLSAGRGTGRPTHTSCIVVGQVEHVLDRAAGLQERHVQVDVAGLVASRVRDRCLRRGCLFELNQYNCLRELLMGTASSAGDARRKRQGHETANAVLLGRCPDRHRAGLSER